MLTSKRGIGALQIHRMMGLGFLSESTACRSTSNSPSPSTPPAAKTEQPSLSNPAPSITAGCARPSHTASWDRAIPQLWPAVARVAAIRVGVNIRPPREIARIVRTHPNIAIALGVALATTMWAADTDIYQQYEFHRRWLLIEPPTRYSQLP
jgi:hypothetical protein